jgi:hypothetical protein
MAARQTGWVTKAANYVMAPTDSGVIVTASCTITLPPDPFRPFRYGVKIIGAGVTVTVQTGGGTVDGAASPYIFGTNGQSVDFAPADDAGNWVIA